MNTKQALQKIENSLKVINTLAYRNRIALTPFRYQLLNKPEVHLPAVLDASHSVIIHPNTYWGEWHRNFVLLSNFCTPDHWLDDSSIALFLPIGIANDFSHPEALVYVDQTPLAGCDRHHQEILLPKCYLDGNDHQLILHGWTGMQRWDGSEPGTQLFMHPCELVQIDQPTRDFLSTARVTLDALKNIKDSLPAFYPLLKGLESSIKLLDFTEPFEPNFYQSISNAHENLKEVIRESGPSLGSEICAIGQSHIDLAWLWTLSQTRLKAGRTFHTILHLMDQFPDFVYTQSQPQLYEYVKQDYPELFESIQRKVADGQWEFLGGMWVEPDCNLSGAEALVRQFILGRNFYHDHFGSEKESLVLWLPDTFGFPWSLPQLMKQAGIRYFHTIKMGWNETNRIPFDSFWWQGLDGTKVLTHFASNECNVFLSPENIIKAWDKYPQKETHHEIALLYGWGDGGGGPTGEMLENLREMGNFPSLPRVSPGKVQDFLERLENTVSNNLPCWNGELYLEKHRGTYTTHAEIKRFNRKSERLLHDAEFLASFAKLLDKNYQYPADVFHQTWKLVCLNQFHDILPGSSIGEVYTDAQKDYEVIEQTGNEICQMALASITAQMGGDWVVANPICYSRNDLAFFPEHLLEGQSLQHQDGEPVYSQSTPNGTVIYPGELLPYSINPLFLSNTPPLVSETELLATSNSLENKYLRVEINQRGEIARLFDKVSNREVLASGQVGNQFQAFEDRPIDSDAWDIDCTYEDKPIAIDGTASITVIENGPLRATIETRRQVLNSEIIQRISLAFNSSRIDFDTFVDWRERHVLLKVAIPVDILSPLATYEIQWGNIQRPTHRNTSWDQARFEVCAHKWVDLSEGGYGVSLLNDCKYGHDIHDNILRLSLLRGSTMPDPYADLGEHRFVYSLLPHEGGWETETSSQAYELNDPIICYKPQGKSQTLLNFSSSSLIVCDSPNVIIETIKTAEDGNGLIVRLFENHRKRGAILLKVNIKLAHVWQTNLLEQNLKHIENHDRLIELQINPFEIITLRLITAT
jgi:alpha-mannosidase